MITQSEIAKRTGIAKESISRYLAGKTVPSLATAKHIADTCNIPIDIFTSRATQQIYFGEVYLKSLDKYEKYAAGGKNDRK